MGDISRGQKKMKRLQLAMEEEELRSLRIPSTAHRGNLSPSKNAILPTLQENTQDHTLSSRNTGQKKSAGLGAAMRQGSGGSGPQSARNLGDGERRGPPADGHSLERLAGEAAGVVARAGSSGACGGGAMEALLNQHVLSHISAEWLEYIKQDFMACGGSLNLGQFLSAMMRSLEPRGGAVGSTARGATAEQGGGADATVERAAALVELFRRADTHDEGVISWDEVSSFLIEQGVTGPENFQSSSVRRYSASAVKDASKHDQHVEKLVYLEHMDVIACLPHKSRGFRLYDPNCTVRNEVQGHKGHRGSLVNCCYVAGLNQIATTGADMSICMWDSTSLGLRNRMTAKDVQLSLCGSAGADNLFSGSIDGALTRWDTTNMCMSETRRGHHKDAINDLLMIDDLNLLASASSDGSTIMWDLETMRPKKVFKGHRKGAFSLAYSPDYRMLVTSGLEQEALVWNPYVERVPVFRLRGHTNALCGVAVMPGTPQVISADVRGQFLIWDIRNFRALGSFGGKEHRLSSLSTFCVLPEHRRVIAGGQCLTPFDCVDDWDGDVTEGGGLADALYNPHFGEFMTFDKKHARVWDACSGTPCKSLPYVHKQEITACCLSSSGRKFYLGEASGRVTSHSTNNGAILATLEAHSKDVSCLEISPGTNKVFSASWDGMLKVHIDEPGRRPYVKAEFAHHKDGVTCLACCGPLNLLATGGNDTQVCIYDLKTLKWEHGLVGLENAVSALAFLEDQLLLGVADHGGFVSLWRTRPHNDQWRQIYRFANDPAVGASPTLGRMHQDLFDLGSKSDHAQLDLAVPLTAIQLAMAGPASQDARDDDDADSVPEACPLALVADAKGFLRCWDLSLVLRPEEPVHEFAKHRGAEHGEKRQPTAHALADAGGGDDFFVTGGPADSEDCRRPVATTVRSAVALGMPPLGKPPSPVLGDLGGGLMPMLLEEVEAHPDGVMRLHSTANPSALVSIGHDSRARVWGLRLQPLGSLLQRRDRGFAFPYDPEAVRGAKLEEAMELVRDVRPAAGASVAKPLAITQVLRLPRLPLPGGAGTPTGMLDFLCPGKRGVSKQDDLDQRWREVVSRVVSDPEADPDDCRAMLEHCLGLAGGGFESHPPGCSNVHLRLLRSAHKKQSEHVAQRFKALSGDEAKAADRLARAMAAVGGDDFGCYATMARGIRPRHLDAMAPLTAR